MRAEQTGIRAFIEAEGIGPSGIDRQTFIRAFKEAMDSGVRGRASSLAMLPTYLSCRGPLPLGSRAVAVDAGGTHFRTALIRFTEAGPEIERFDSCAMPGTSGAVAWEDFVSFCAGRLRPLAVEARHIGLCISFPMEITPQGDGMIRQLTKEVDIRSFEGRLICRDILDKLGLPGARAICLNDTTAVLLSGLAAGAESEGLVGLINGTGTNVCCQLPRAVLGLEGEGRMIVDVESGGFIPPERGELDLLLDSGTASPGSYLEEKLVSGAYLGELCRLALRKAAEQGLFPRSAGGLLRLEILPTPQADSFGAGGPLEPFADPGEAEDARQIVSAVFRRAAKHVACTLAAVIEFSGLEAGRPAAVAADGSVFSRSVLFRPALEAYAADCCPGRSLRFVEQENATLIGTAAAGAMLGM